MTLGRHYGPVLAERLGFDVLMRYEDAQGDLSERVVTVHVLHGTIHGSPPEFDLDYMRGLCHERRAVRTFRTDRIRSLADPHTGELATHPELWLCHRAGLCDPDVTALVRFTGPEALPVRATEAEVLWQRSPGVTESFSVAIDEVHRRSQQIVGFRGQCRRRPKPGLTAWQGDKTFDLNLGDGDGVLCLEFDGTLFEEIDEIAAWLGSLRSAA